MDAPPATAVTPAATMLGVRAPAVRAVATAFLRRRPLLVAPVLLAFLVGIGAGGAPRAQVLAVAGFASVALAFFAGEAVRARRHVVSARGLFLSLAVTMLGITAAAVATGASASPLVFMLFAPTVIGFAAFGRGRASNGLFGLAAALLVGLALVPVGVPFPPVPAAVRPALVVVAAAGALVLLRVGVVALTDAHAVARAAAERAGDQVVAAAAARGAAIEAMGAKVAHEVRNPLSAVRGLCEVLAENASDARDRRRLDVMLGEVDRIDAILTGYLANARPLEQLHRVPIDVAALLAEVAAVVEARAERAGVALTVAAAPLAGVLDPQRLKEALLNLVLNALAATPAGGDVRLEAAPGPGGIVIRVLDTGAGMDAAALARAGTPFVTGRAGGTGLGLALCRQVIEQHGGQLALESQPGHGTRAEVTLPQAPPEPRPPSEEEERA